MIIMNNKEMGFSRLKIKLINWRWWWKSEAGEERDNVCFILKKKLSANFSRSLS